LRLKAIPARYRSPSEPKRTTGSPEASSPFSGEAVPAADVSVGKPGTIVLKPCGNGGDPNHVVPPSYDR
jgi:hypothetical protein